MPSSPSLERSPSTDGTVTSTDGTRIAWSREGAGPPLVMVECVAASRATSPQPTLPAALAEHFTVFRYDRRGKGDSPTTAPYAVEREFEDLAAVLALVDGPTDVYGFSSGATLALLAAAAGVPIRRLALLEPPLSSEDDANTDDLDEFERRYAADPADGHRWFTTEVVGVPPEVLATLPPPSAQVLADAATISHELTFLPGATVDRFAGLATPTLLVSSDDTAPEMARLADLAVVMPNASLRVLPGEWHTVDDATLTPAVREFLHAPDHVLSAGQPA
jgi:pimeloyl-ACP methyl ester carboxylesterase